MANSEKQANFCPKCGTSYSETKCPKCSRTIFSPKKLIGCMTVIVVLGVLLTFQVFRMPPQSRSSLDAFRTHVYGMFSFRIFPRKKCVDNLKLIGLACFSYAGDNHGFLPRQFDEKLKPYLGSATYQNILNCPMSNLPYVYNDEMRGRNLSEIKSPSQTMLIYDSPNAHKDKVNVLFADGHVESLMTKHFTSALKRQVGIWKKRLSKKKKTVTEKQGKATKTSPSNEKPALKKIRDMKKPTPALNKKLCQAWSRRDMKEVAELLDKGANADVKINSAFGGTALHDAVVMKNESIVKMLLKHGANVNAKAEFGHTPLNFASDRAYSIKMMKLLIENGADINARDHLGRSPLIVAVDKRNSKMAEFLIANGADVNIRYVKHNKGNTVLHKAVDGHNVKIVKLLVNAGADIDAKGKSGKSTYSEALNWNYSKRQQRKRKYIKDMMEIKEILIKQKREMK